MKLDSEEVEIVKEHLIITRDIPDKYEESSFRNTFVYINKERDEALEAEGYAREVMRRTQRLRKKAGLQKKDEIKLFVKLDEELENMLKPWTEQIKEKVGASVIKISQQEPAKKHKNHSREKVKGKSFELFFD